MMESYTEFDIRELSFILFSYKFIQRKFVGIVIIHLSPKYLSALGIKRSHNRFIQVHSHI